MDGMEEFFRVLDQLHELDPQYGWKGTGGKLKKAFEEMDWAEEQIARAKRQYPDAAAKVGMAFRLLMPVFDMPGQEVYRAHCRELLDRVVAGEDTRPPTAAEICTVCMQASQVAPFREGAFLVYMRAFQKVFPHRWRHVTSAEELEAQERVNGWRADELERTLVRRLTVKNRVVGKDFDRLDANVLAEAMEEIPTEAA